MSKYKKYSTEKLYTVYRKKQRHLIIPNIIIMIIALVAIISSVCLPMFEMTMHINGEGMVTLAESYLTDDGESSDEDETSQFVIDALKDLDVDFKISIYR
ncbi:MAG: hypothetical protein LUI60_07415 [Clostridia bacterium]|nr:hypothetical protein [Clostridia bacterium]